MIHYELRCAAGHGFDGWFRGSAAFDQQARDGLLECPVCASPQVSRAMMAPRLSRGARPPAVPAETPIKHATNELGAEGSGPEKARLEKVGPERAGTERAGPERAGPEKAGPEKAGPEKAGAPAPSEVAVGGPPAMPDRVRAVLQRIRAEVEQRCDYVGPRFAEAARAMHDGKVAPRPIYGETTPDQAEALAEDGIEVASIPWVPRADG